MGRVALHVERHFSGSETVRDVVIGMSDGLTVPFALAAGGILPLLPYFSTLSITQSLLLSAIMTALALAAFGWVKGRFTGVVPGRSAGQTVLVGGLAAGAAYVIARLISGFGG